MYSGPNRKHQRLKGFDYAENGAYFVTICTKNRENYFGEIIEGKMILNEYGRIVESEIIKTGEIRNEILINEFVIMPNHLHLIIEIENYKQGRERLQSFPTGALGLGGNNLSAILRGLKGTITKQINEFNNEMLFSWQKSFYERIIRNENELIKIKEYIINNPLQREFDKNNPINL